MKRIWMHAYFFLASHEFFYGGDSTKYFDERDEQSRLSSVLPYKKERGGRRSKRSLFKKCYGINISDQREMFL